MPSDTLIAAWLPGAHGRARVSGPARRVYAGRSAAYIMRAVANRAPVHITPEETMIEYIRPAGRGRRLCREDPADVAGQFCELTRRAPIARALLP